MAGMAPGPVSPVRPAAATQVSVASRERSEVMAVPSQAEVT